MRVPTLSAIALTAGPASLLTITTYTALVLSVLITNFYVPSPPKDATLNQIWADLYEITRQPHPYNSHDNDAVHSHLLSRIREEVNGTKWEVFEDMQSNFTHWTEESTIYFEGTNILLHLPGPKPFLVSAHYDSVATGFGATDNGAGVAIVLSLIRKFADSPRGIVLNLNNGEEGGLNGARAFLQHPLSTVPVEFLNLEGAGSGGHALLGRAQGSMKAYDAKQPFVSVITSDFASSGIVRSTTDFVIYRDRYDGLDLHFIAPRSWYHTSRDTPQNMGIESVAHMKDTVFRTVERLARRDVQGDQEVFFSLFATTLIRIPLKVMYAINIVMLVVVPLAFGGIIIALQRQGLWKITFRGWGRFPVAFLVAAGATVLVSFLIVKVNAEIIYSSSFVVLACLFALIFIVFESVLKVFDVYRPAQHHKDAVIFELLGLWWVVLLFTTIYFNARGYGSSYLVTVTFFGVVVAAAISLAEMGAESKLEEQLLVPGSEEEGEEEEDLEANETTPLIGDNTVEKSERVGLWILQFAFLAPIPLILTLEILVIVVQILSQTLADGNSITQGTRVHLIANLVYAFYAFLTFLSILPITPFLHRLHPSVKPVLVLLFLGTLIYSLLAFPFSFDMPLKLFYKQDMIGNATTMRVSGIKNYIGPITRGLPEAIGRDVNCIDRASRDGLRQCSFNISNEYTFDFEVESSRTTTFSTRFKIRPDGNSRNCKLYLPVAATSLHVIGSLPTTLSNGTNVIDMYVRDWDREIIVDVAWEDEVYGTVNVTCLFNDGISRDLGQPRWTQLSNSALERGLLEKWKTVEL